MTRRRAAAWIAGMAIVSAAVGTALQATSNLETVAFGGTVIVNRVWYSAAFPIPWRFHDPTTQSGCYSATNAPVAGLQPASNAGFTTWVNDPDSTLTVTYGGTTTTRSIGNDGINVVTFCDAAVLMSNLGFLASTPTTALTENMTVTAGGGCPPGRGILDLNGNPPPAGYCVPVGTYPAGTIVDGDIRFNSFSNFEQVNFSTNGAAGTADIQSIITHEIGHFFGLSHDPIPQAVLYPFIDDEPASDGIGQRVLKRSDLSTVGRFYPEPTYSSDFGSITGFVTLDGMDADGVHVVAVNPATMLGVSGRFSLTRFGHAASLGPDGPDFAANGTGFYRIDGLPPGDYYVYVEYFDNSDFITERLLNRYNSTVANSSVATGCLVGSPGCTTVAGDLGFLPRLTEFYNTGDSGNGGDGVNPGVALDNSDVATPVTVTAGMVTPNINIAINIEDNAGTPDQRENPTTRTTILNDQIQGSDEITGFLLDGGTDNFYAVRYPASVLPTPPFNIAEGKWQKAGRTLSPMVTRLTFTDPISVTVPDMANPVVASAGRVLVGGPNGSIDAGDFADVRDQWNVTITEPRDVWIIINQPEAPPLTQFLTQGYFALVTRQPAPDPNGNRFRVGRSLITEDAGASWFLLNADVFYDLIVEQDPPVMITGTTPANVAEGDTVTVQINGAGFQSGATVEIGPNVAVNTCTFVSAQRIDCNITVAMTGATNDRRPNVKVTNPEVVFPNVARPLNVQPFLDSDGDGLGNSQDCSPFNGTLKRPATEVMNDVVTLLPGGDVEIGWDSQDPSAGTATRYDVVRGSLSDVLGSRTYAAAVCAVNNDADTPFVDATAVAPGQVLYWLIRAQNACTAGPGTYGDSSLVPDPRNALDSTVPCAN